MFDDGLFALYGLRYPVTTSGGISIFPETAGVCFAGDGHRIDVVKCSVDIGTGGAVLPNNVVKGEIGDRQSGAGMENTQSARTAVGRTTHIVTTGWENQAEADIERVAATGDKEIREVLARAGTGNGNTGFGYFKATIIDPGTWYGC